jgi:hypothetical protein
MPLEYLLPLGGSTDRPQPRERCEFELLLDCTFPGCYVGTAINRFLEIRAGIPSVVGLVFNGIILRYGRDGITADELLASFHQFSGHEV